ncbi:MAG TPA: glycosyltransferase family 2 protein [Acidimicrobiales bacterium]|nr:glycosyltransferase family 2 protein [Acidimicrobiales bacterium]
MTATLGGAVDVSIVVVSFNTASLTTQCLAAVPGAVRDRVAETIVVDNASTDGSVPQLRTHHPGVAVIASDENLGFARAVNLAASTTAGRWLLLLNPDTVAEPGSIDRLVAFAEAHPGHGIYGGRTVDPAGEVDPRSCWGLPSLWSLTCWASLADAAFRGSRLLDPESLGRWPRDSVREVGLVTGCLLLVDRQLWERLGGFDERYFMYGEDADLCLRAGQLGHRPVVTPAAAVTHIGGASPIHAADKTVLQLRAKVTLIRSHWRPWRVKLGVALTAIGVANRAVAARLLPVGAHRSRWSEVWQARSTWLAGYPQR